MVVDVYMSEAGRDLMLASNEAPVILAQPDRTWRFMFELDIRDPLLEAAITEATQDALVLKGYVVIPRAG